MRKLSWTAWRSFRQLLFEGDCRSTSWFSFAERLFISSKITNDDNDYGKIALHFLYLINASSCWTFSILIERCTTSNLSLRRSELFEVSVPSIPSYKGVSFETLCSVQLLYLVWLHPRLWLFHKECFEPSCRQTFVSRLDSKTWRASLATDLMSSRNYLFLCLATDTKNDIRTILQKDERRSTRTHLETTQRAVASRSPCIESEW